MTDLTRAQFLLAGGRRRGPAATRTPAPLAALAAALRGPVLLPGQRRLRARAPVFNGRYDGVRPAAVAQPLDARDLAAALRVARARGIAVRLRAGGHSYIGASTVAGGVILDLRRLRGIELMADGSVLAGAGLRQIELIARARRRGRAVVHGSCPTVGVAGFTLGGGYGFDARRYGLSCDNLLAARRRSTCARSSPPPPTPSCCAGLRGAGASLAPVTVAAAAYPPCGSRDDVLRPLPVVARRRDRARLRARVRLGAGAARRHLLALDRQAARRRSRSSASTSAPAAAATRAIAALLEPGAASLSQNMHSYLDAQLIFAGCLGRTLAQCRPAERGRHARPRHVRRRLGLPRPRAHRTPPARLRRGRDRRAPGRGAAPASCCSTLRAARSTSEPPSQTSFVHRGLRCSVQILSYEEAARAQAFVAAARAVLAPRRQRSGVPELPRRESDVLAHGLLRDEVRRPGGLEARTRPVPPAALPAGDRLLGAPSRQDHRAPRAPR